MRIETVKIKSDSHPSGYIIVNKDRAEKHQRPTESKTEAPKRATRSRKTEA